MSSQKPAQTPPTTPSLRGAQGVSAVVLVVILLLVVLLLWPNVGDSERTPGAESETHTPAPAESPTQQAKLSESTIARLDDALAGSTAQSAAAVVIDPESGQQLYAASPDDLLLPASNQKIVTELSVLHFLGADRRLATTVVDGQDDDTVVLVAGGDTLLAPGQGDPHAVQGRAGIADLAHQAAQTMDLSEGSSTVTVQVDTSLFTGSGLNDSWLPGDIAGGEVGPVSPMAFGSHAVLSDNNQPTGSYDSDAASSVADVFASTLSQKLTERTGRSIAVEVGESVDTPADPLVPADQQDSVTELARVESATIQEQSTIMMRESDNRLAESLCRVAAVSAGQPGDSEGARSAITQAMKEVLGQDLVPQDGAVLSDCAGVSPDNRMTAALLGEVLAAAARESDGAHRVMGDTFPTPGEGTLSDRFHAPEATAGRERVRAKTGTLHGVTALSGEVITEDDDRFIAVVILNDTADRQAARDSSDRFFAALAQSKAA
ncbi:MAG: D-alanyl-D-alanine carboxypeptidase [Kocuria sp.]|nr:D-alanyl-D-alanine carboxypeptidase [Kocuria sp.]